jgi:hypothetical protein
MPRGLKKGVNIKKFDRCDEKVEDKSGKSIPKQFAMLVWLEKQKEVNQNKNKINLS